MDTNRKENEQDLVGAREGKTVIRTYCMKNNLFSVKVKYNGQKKNNRTSQSQKEYFKLLK